MGMIGSGNVYSCVGLKVGHLDFFWGGHIKHTSGKYDLKEGEE